MRKLNINVGLLGHVDSGKTALAKALSTTPSTACFDKNPQSQERGITLDLGFSCFQIVSPTKIQELGYDSIQITLVDCPGHASLIRTIIGGAQIIDIVLLVVDATKGIQTQTAECLVITEIMQKRMMVVLNKVDLIPSEKREATVAKVTKRLEKTLENTVNKSARIVPVSATSESGGTLGLDKLTDELVNMVVVPQRDTTKPVILCVDHCFGIKGKGTVMTGTVLQGTLKLNDTIEVAEAGITRKVKSLQMFKENVAEASAGDRVGVCVTQLDPKQLERGLVTAPNLLSTVYAVIFTARKIKYFKHSIRTNGRIHVSVGYETVIARATLFHSKCDQFQEGEMYELAEEWPEERDTMNVLLEFESPVQSHLDAFVIASKLDLDHASPSCRLAFYGSASFILTDKSYRTTFLPNLLIYKWKEKSGVIHKLHKEGEVIVHNLFKKHSSIEPFINAKVSLSTGETGHLAGSFGLKGKCLVRVDLSPESKFKITSKHDPQSDQRIKVNIQFKKFVFNKNKKIVQN